MSIQVTAQKNPFSTKKTEYTFESGLSVKEIIAKIDTLHAVNTGWRVLFDDEIVTDFSRIPCENQHVYIKLVPEGDSTEDTGTGMKAAGAGLAVLGVIVSCCSFGLAAPLGAALIGAGISLFAGGMVLYNTDVSTSSTESSSQDPSIRGSQNQAREYGTIPTLLGKRRIYPDLAAESHTMVDPDTGDMYLLQLLCAGQKDMTIDTSTIKIDETLLADYSESGDIDTILSGGDSVIDMRIHQDGTLPEMFDSCVHEDQVHSQLVHEDDDGVDGSIVRTTPDKTEEINVDIFFPNGLGTSSGESATVQVCAYYKKASEDDSAYQLMGAFDPSAKVAGTTYTQYFKITGTKFTTLGESVIWNAFSSWAYSSGDKFTVDSSDKSKYTLKITSYNYKQKEYGHDGNRVKTYYTNILFSVSYKDPDTYGSNTITASKLSTLRYAITLTGLEADSYTVKFTRVTEDSDSSSVIDAVYVGSVRAIKHEAPVSAEIAARLTLIELKIKATSKLSGTISQLNFIAQSKLPVYAGSGSGSDCWSNALSSNPASAMLYALKGDVAQRVVPDDAIDWEKLEAFSLWCDEHEYECNAYISDEITLQDLLSNIGSTSRAEAVRLNGLITVIQDIERSTPVQLFTPRNSHDYSETFALADIPDEIRMTFVDEDGGYDENTCSVYNTDKGNKESVPETTQGITLWGVTSSVQARRLGMYKYAVSRLRPIVHTFSCDFEYLMCTKGDWIRYAGDIALAGISQGRIVSRVLDESNEESVTGFELDEALTMESGKSYALRVRLSDGSMTLLELENSGETSKTVTLSTALSADDAPKAGDLFAFGETGNESIDLIVTDITCSDNLTAELTCVEYAEAVFDVDSDGFVIPDFDSKIASVVGGVTDSGGVSKWTTFFTYNDSTSEPDKPTGDGTNNGWHYVQTDESRWVSTKKAQSVNDGSWSTPIATGVYTTEQIEKVISGTSDVGSPSAVTFLAASATADSIRIEWTPSTDEGLANSIKDFVVEIKKGSTAKWEAVATVTDSSCSYQFDRTTDGYPEASTLETWAIRVKAENIYGSSSDYTTLDAGGIVTTNYGTWIVPAITGTTAVADRDGITITWSATIVNGTNSFIVTVNNGSATRTALVTGTGYAYYTFDRTAGEYPEASEKAGNFSALTDYVITVTQTNGVNTVTASPTSVNVSNYLTWIPAKVTDLIAVAEKDTISLSWKSDQSSVYGTPVYTVKKNGATKKQTGDNVYTYYFNRLTDGYPEAGKDEFGVSANDFETDTWAWTVTVSNESTATNTDNANTASAEYNLSAYKTWLPFVPKVSASVSGRAIALSIATDESYWGWVRYEVQVSKDRNTWYSVGSGDAYTVEAAWQGTQNAVTPFYGAMYEHVYPLANQSSSTPVDTTYYFRVRAVTHTATDKYSSSSNWQDSWAYVSDAKYYMLITATAKATAAVDIVAGAVNAARLATSAVTTDKLASCAVTGAKIAAGAVTADKICADTAMFRCLNVVATNLVNPIICDTVGCTPTGWSNLVAYKDTETGLVIGKSTSCNASITSNEFTVLPNALYEVKFGLQASASTAGSGLFLGLSAGQTFIPYTWSPSAKKWTPQACSSNAYFISNYTSCGRRYYTTYILGAKANICDLPAPTMTDSAYAIAALQLTGTCCTARLRTGYSAVCSGMCWYLIAPQVYERNSASITAENIYTCNLAAVNANLGSVMAGSIASDTSAAEATRASCSKLYINANAGSEEFYIGNVAKGVRSDTCDAHQFLHFNSSGLIMKIANFIVTSVASIIRGTFKVTTTGTTKYDALTVTPGTGTANAASMAFCGSMIIGTANCGNCIYLPAAGTTGCKSTCITSSACTDGWDIYGQVGGSDQYNLIMNLRDDGSNYVGFAGNGTVKSCICGANGSFYGNVCGAACAIPVICSAACVTDTSAILGSNGRIAIHNVYNNGAPYRYGNILTIAGVGDGQLFLPWDACQTQAGQSAPNNHLYYRSRRDNQSSWTAWTTIIDSQNILAQSVASATCACMPLGFASRDTGAAWGDTTGTSFTVWNDAGGGSIDFRCNNPSAGKMSVKVDGRFYVGEGAYPVASMTCANGYWGMRDPDGGDDWIRTTTNGIIPVQGGGYTAGHSSLGTSSWYFATSYVQTSWVGRGGIRSGDTGIRIGNSCGAASAAGSCSVAIGACVFSSGSGSVAIGGYTAAATCAYGNQSTALGSAAKANGCFSTAVGFNARADGIESIAIGHNAVADKNSIAIGVSANNTVSGSVTIGTCSLSYYCCGIYVIASTKYFSSVAFSHGDVMFAASSAAYALSCNFYCAIWDFFYKKGYGSCALCANKVLNSCGTASDSSCNRLSAYITNVYCIMKGCHARMYVCNNNDNPVTSFFCGDTKANIAYSNTPWISISF